MEIKLINAAYQDRKQMKRAKNNLRPPGGGGGGKFFFENGYNFFFSVLKLRVEDFSKCLPYKASGAFELIPITFGRSEQKEKGKKRGQERKGGRRCVLKGFEVRNKVRGLGTQVPSAFLEIFFNSQLHSKL